MIYEVRKIDLSMTYGMVSKPIRLTRNWRIRKALCKVSLWRHLWSHACVTHNQHTLILSALWHQSFAIKSSGQTSWQSHNHNNKQTVWNSAASLFRVQITDIITDFPIANDVSVSFAAKIAACGWNHLTLETGDISTIAHYFICCRSNRQFTVEVDRTPVLYIYIYIYIYILYIYGCLLSFIAQKAKIVDHILLSRT